MLHKILSSFFLIALLIVPTLVIGENAAASAITRIYLVRHGQTQWNVEKRVNGHSDIPLNEIGVQQARLAAEKFASWEVDVDAVYSSDLQRALVTGQFFADKIGFTQPIVPYLELRETNMGIAEGMTVDERSAVWGNKGRELDALYPVRSERWNHAEVPEAETLNQVAARFKNCLLELAKKHPRQTILVISHGNAINAFLTNLLDRDMRPITNCAIIELFYLPEETVQPFRFIQIDRSVEESVSSLFIPQERVALAMA